MKLFFLILGIILVLPLVSSQLIFEQDKAVNISVPCSFNETECSSDAVCNWSVFNPEYIKIASGKALNISDESFFQVNLSSGNTSELGDYFINMFCVDQNYGDASTTEFTVTPLGKQLTTAQSIAHIFTLLAAIFMFVMAVVGAIKLPWKDSRTADGRLMSVSDLKYLKLLCGVIAYLILIWILALAEDISDAYLFLSGATNFFHVIGLIALSIFYALIILLPWFIIINIMQDKKTKDMIKRGLNPR